MTTVNEVNEVNEVKVYQVGGSVRDKLLGLPHHDLDYAVECGSFEQMVKYLTDQGYTIYSSKPEYGCVKARKGDEITSDFTICRKDGNYSDNRRPDTIVPSNLITDLSRRDFTMNAIAIDDTEQFIDPFGGREDIRRRIIKCVGDPVDRLVEDPLRGIRALNRHQLRSIRQN